MGWSSSAFLPRACAWKQAAARAIIITRATTWARYRELTDAAGQVRARYSYDPFGRRTKVSGDLDADFGFAGMLWSAEAALYLTHYRAYDPELGRWLSRDPIRNPEIFQGPSLYAYVRNNPANLVDPLGMGGAPPWWWGPRVNVNPPPYQPAPPVNPAPPPAPTPPPNVTPPEPVPPSSPPQVPPELQFPVEFNPTGIEAPVATAGTGTAVATSEIGLGTVGLCGAGSLVVGAGIGTLLDYEFNLSGQAADMGEEFEELSGSSTLGGIITVEEAINPFSWLRNNTSLFNTSLLEPIHLPGITD